MSTVKPGDMIAVYRGSTLYHAPADMSTVQDTDLILVQRGNVPHKCTFLDWKNSQSRAPVIGGVALADSPEAGRFTSGTFASTVTMTEEGIPASTKGLKAWVEGSLKSAVMSSAITAVTTDPAPTRYEARAFGGTYPTPAPSDPSTMQWSSAQVIDSGITVGMAPPSSGGSSADIVLFKNTTGSGAMVYGIQPDVTGNTSGTLDAWVSNDGTSWTKVASGNLEDFGVHSPNYKVPATSTLYAAIRRTDTTLQPINYFVTGGQGLVHLTLTDATDLTRFAAGDAATEVGHGDDGTGTVKAVDAAAVPPTMTLSGVGGTWNVGSKVKGPLKTNIVTVTPNSDVITAVSTATGPTYSSLLSSPAGGSVADASSAFDNDLSTIARSTGTVLELDLTATPLTGNLEVASLTGPSNSQVIIKVTDDGGTLRTIYDGPAATSPPCVYVPAGGISVSNCTTIQLTRPGISSKLGAVRINGTVLVDGVSRTQLTFATDKDLAKFASGDAITQENSSGAPTYSNLAYRSPTSSLTYDPAEATAQTGWADPPTHAFDGVLTTAGISSSASGGGTWFYLKNMGLTGVTQLRLRLRGTRECRVNGNVVTLTPNPSGFVTTYDWVTVTSPPGTVNEIAIQGQNTGGDALNAGLAAVEVNGTVLVDGTGIEPRGTVGSVDTTAKTMTLATSTGTWGPANAGHHVIGPTKTGPASNVKLYTVHDAAGAVSDLQSADPGFVTMTGNGPYTLTWPATLPSGNPPDTDLPAGTTITTEVQATNTAGTVTKTSNTVTPA